MKASGLEDIVFSTGVFGKGTINKVMSGKDYYKMLYCHSLASEAMIQLKWEAFEESLMEADKIVGLEPLAEKLNQLISSMNEDEKNVSEIKRVLESTKEVLTEIKNGWEALENGMGLTARFWNMYIDMISILKRYVHAERAGNWEEHLSAARSASTH